MERGADDEADVIVGKTCSLSRILSDRMRSRLRCRVRILPQGSRVTVPGPD